jgi:hypothetical protein
VLILETVLDRDGRMWRTSRTDARKSNSECVCWCSVRKTKRSSATPIFQSSSKSQSQERDTTTTTTSVNHLRSDSSAETSQSSWRGRNHSTLTNQTQEDPMSVLPVVKDWHPSRGQTAGRSRRGETDQSVIIFDDYRIHADFICLLSLIVDGDDLKSFLIERSKSNARHVGKRVVRE